MPCFLRALFHPNPKAGDTLLVSVRLRLIKKQWLFGSSLATSGRLWRIEVAALRQMNSPDPTLSSRRQGRVQLGWATKFIGFEYSGQTVVCSVTTRGAGAQVSRWNETRHTNNNKHTYL